MEIILNKNDRDLLTKIYSELKRFNDNMDGEKGRHDVIEANTRRITRLTKSLERQVQ